MKFHPDRNPGDADRSQIQRKSAKPMTSSRTIKKAPADLRSCRVESGMGRRPRLRSIFGQLLGCVRGSVSGDLMGGRRSRRSNRGQDDLRYNLEIAGRGLFRPFAVMPPPWWLATPAMAQARRSEHRSGNPVPAPVTSKVRAAQGFFTILSAAALVPGHRQIIRHPCRRPAARCKASGAEGTHPDGGRAAGGGGRRHAHPHLSARAGAGGHIR